MPSATNATELYILMHDAVTSQKYLRTATDLESVQTAETVEAKPGSSFELRVPQYNVQSCAPVDVPWAIANTLHFFAETEAADALPQYNKHAEKFLVREDGALRWRGAYGAIAVPQVRACVERLRYHPYSRRAIVSMGDGLAQDQHRPACWSFLQFLNASNGLNLLVYQRSLNLSRVMQYDLIVLTNLLVHVAKSTGLEVGSLHWTVGSLHTVGHQEVEYKGRRHMSLVLPHELTRSPSLCRDALDNPSRYSSVWEYRP